MVEGDSESYFRAFSKSGVRRIKVPWAGEASRFTLLFEQETPSHRA